MQTRSQPAQLGTGLQATLRKVRLDIARIGHLVPRAQGAWRVHSVFAHACNFTCGDRLITLVAPHLGGGPATLVLRQRPTPALDRLFAVGEVVSRQATTLCSRHVALHLEHAERWQPPRARALLPWTHIETNLALAAELLAAHRQQRTSVLVDEAAGLVRTLARATRALDYDGAAHAIEHLVGWGEGLTPACDDFLVGWIAALDALAITVAQQRFRKAIGPTLARHTVATTPIAAHFLRLAAAGHYIEVLDRVRDAVLCEPNRECVPHAIERTLALGATSGADLLSGLLCAIDAWRPHVTTAEH
jgi:hypothetical protein